MQVVKADAYKWNQTQLLDLIRSLSLCLSVCLNNVIFDVSLVQLQLSVSERTEALEKLQSIMISVEQQLNDLSDAKV